MWLARTVGSLATTPMFCRLPVWGDKKVMRCTASEIKRILEKKFADFGIQVSLGDMRHRGLSMSSRIEILRVDPAKLAEKLFTMMKLASAEGSLR